MPDSWEEKQGEDFTITVNNGGRHRWVGESQGKKGEFAEITLTCPCPSINIIKLGFFCKLGPKATFHV